LLSARRGTCAAPLSVSALLPPLVLRGSGSASCSSSSQFSFTKFRSVLVPGSAALRGGVLLRVPEDVVGEAVV
jgi:hypothetical protein